MSVSRTVRWWLAVLILAACAAGCAPKADPTPGPALATIPNETAFEIRRVGLRSGLNERIWLDDGLLRRESRDEFGELVPSHPITMSPARLERLEATLARYAAWQWQSSYVNTDLFDGESMHVTAHLNGRLISTDMLNRGPAFAEDGILTYSNYGLGMGEDLLRDLRSWFERPPM